MLHRLFLACNLSANFVIRFVFCFEIELSLYDYVFLVAKLLSDEHSWRSKNSKKSLVVRSGKCECYQVHWFITRCIFLWNVSLLNALLFLDNCEPTRYPPPFRYPNFHEWYIQHVALISLKYQESRLTLLYDYSKSFSGLLLSVPIAVSFGLYGIEPTTK